MSAPLHTAPTVRLTQTPARVTGAELRRLLRRGGMPGGVITAISLGLAIGAVCLIVLASIAQGESRVTVTAPVELAGFVAALAVAIAVVFSTGRDASTHLRVALTLTPDRQRLHFARCVANASVGASVCAIATAPIALVGVLAAGSRFAHLAVLGIVLASLAGASLALIAQALTVLARRSSAAILIFIGLLVVLPLALTTGAGLLPTALIGPVEVIARVTPTPLLMTAIGVSAVPSQGITAAALSQAGLALWGIGASVLAGWAFGRREA